MFVFSKNDEDFKFCSQFHEMFTYFKNFLFSKIFLFSIKNLNIFLITQKFFWILEHVLIANIIEFMIVF